MQPTSKDDFEQLPSIAVSADDASGHHGKRGGRKADRLTQPPTDKQQQGEHSLLRLFGLSRRSLGVVLVAAALPTLVAVVGGYLLWTKVQEGRSQLQVLSAQLLDVRNDHTVPSHLETIRGELKVIDHEIRKLWDLVNKRNRPQIEAQVKRLDKFINTFEGTEKSLKGTIKNISADVKRVKEGMGELSSLREEHLTMQDMIEDLQKTADGLSDELSSSVAKSLSSTKVSIGLLQKQLRRTDEQVRAIDVYRQQVSSRLLQLEASVRKLGGAGNRGSGLDLKPVSP